MGTNSKKYDTKDWIIRPTYGKVRRACKYFKFLLAYIAIYFPVESRDGPVLGQMKRSLGRELVNSK